MRKLSGMVLMIVMASLLAACGSEDEETESARESTVEAVSTEAAEETPTEETIGAIGDAGDATPASLSTPGGIGTPAGARSPVVVASPAVATPAAGPAATPEAGSAAVAAPAHATPATPGEPSAMIPLSGSVILPGAENEAFIVTDDGCMGLGEFSDMQADRQVVVRDETGTIIGVATLEASEASDGCAWDFALDVPASEFYSVSIPMAAEHVFTHDEIERSDGEIAITLS